MLFPKTILCETKGENAYFGKLISSINRVHIYRNGIWNDCRPSHTVTGWHCLLKYGRLQKQKTKLALMLHTNERKWQQLPFQLHLIIDKIPIRLGQGELTYIFCFHYNVQNASCAVCSSKWCCILRSDQFKLFIFTDLLNFHSPVSCYFPLLLHSLKGCLVLLCYCCHQ